MIKLKIIQKPHFLLDLLRSLFYNSLRKDSSVNISFSPHKAKMNWQTVTFFNYFKFSKEEWIKDLSSHLFLALLVIFKFWDYLNPYGEFYWAGDFLEVTPMRDYFYHNLKKGILILWDSHIATGMPYLAADYGVFYPIDLLMGILGQDYFVPYRLALIHALHFWLGGLFTFIYTRQLGLSRFPALTSSICFILGGFLLGHAYHRNVIQTYIWFPLILYFLDKALHHRNAIWAMVAGLILAVSFLAGHANFFYFIILFLAFYFLLRVYLGIQEKNWRNMTVDASYFMIMGIFCLGISAIQLFPVVFTSLNTHHASFPFEWKAQLPFPLFNLIHFLIPDYTQWAAFDIGEQYGYIGVLPLLFAIWSIFQMRDKRVIFFALVAFFAFIASLGELTPLYKILYHFLPGLNQFRIPSRFNALIIFPLAVLAGFGFQFFLDQNNREQPTRIKESLKGFLFLFLGLGLIIFSYLEFFYLPSLESTKLSSGPWGLLRKGFFWFLFLWGASYCLISRRNQNRSTLLLKIFMVVLISIDLLFLGRIEGGGSPTDPALISPQAQTIIKEIKKGASPFRISNREKQLSPLSLSREGISDYDADNWVGYIGTIVPQEYLGIYFLINKNPALLDLINVRYYIGSKLKMNTGPKEFKIGGTGEDKEFFLNYPIKISSLILYTSLANSTSIPRGQTVARIHFQKKDGSIRPISIRAGIETAEWAIDRPGLRCFHQKAQVAESWEISHEGYQGHAYIFKTTFSVPIEISKIRFEYLGDQGSLIIKKMLINNLEIDAIYPEIIKERFQWIAPNIYNNKFCLPRIFMISRAKVIPEEKVLLKNLEQLDPRDHVLLNHLPPDYLEPVDSGFSTQEAEINHYSSGKIKITTKARVDKFLILSDTYSPYWKAMIDQRVMPILKADYGLRGLYVPRGNHQVEFSFHFYPFYYGLAISCFSLLMLIITFCGLFIRNRIRHEKPSCD